MSPLGRCRIFADRHWKSYRPETFGKGLAGVRRRSSGCKVVVEGGNGKVWIILLSLKLLGVYLNG